MATQQDLWTFLKNQQERLALLASLLALGVGMVTSFLNKANPPIISLSVFTALIVGVGIWMFFAREPVGEGSETAPLMRKRRYSMGQIVGAWAGGALLLAAVWSFLYRDHIRYSMLADRILGGPRVILSAKVAWHVLDKGSTIADELASLLSGLPHRIVVMGERDLAKFKATKRDGFIVEGNAEGLGLVLRAHMVINSSRAEKLIEDLKSVKSVGRMSAGWLLRERFLPNQFLLSRFTVEAPLILEIAGEQRTTAARLLLHYALATMLYHDGNSDATRVFRDIVTIGTLLPPSLKSTPLASIYKTTGYYLAVHKSDIDGALKALDFAHSLAPSDGQIDVMRIYLLLASGHVGQARNLLEQLTASPDDPAIVYALKGEYFKAVSRFKEAIEAYEMALKTEHDAVYRASLHASIALAHAMSDPAKLKGRAVEMIKHLEDAIQVQPQFLSLYLLKGFAWALQGNETMFRSAFAQGSSLVKTTEEKRQLAYWLGRSLFELKQFQTAIEELEGLLGDLKEIKEPGLLLVVGQNLFEIPGREVDAEQYFDQVIQLELDNGKAHRYKGLAVIKRMWKIPASDVEQRHRLNQQARYHLLKAIRLGDEKAPYHGLLDYLYQDMGDSFNAEKHRRRACELDSTRTDCSSALQN